MPKRKNVVGYKVFDNNFSCQGFRYEVGETYTHKGKISLCESGFHFCPKLADCFRYYPLVQWSKFAEVEAIGEVVEGGHKCVTDRIKVAKELSFDEVIEILKMPNFDFDSANVVNCSDGVSSSKGVNHSNGVNYSNSVSNSNGVNYSYGVNCSDGVNNSNGVNYSNGVHMSRGIADSFGISECKALSDCLFCTNITAKQYYLFNKKVTKARINKIKEQLFGLIGDWRPTYNNLRSLYLKSDKRWAYSPIPFAQEISVKEAWADMPVCAVDFLKTLPEFDADIFKQVTGIELLNIQGGSNED